ncbi:monocarboxylate transporter 12-like isoform X2 [Actinia tenebrosa]|nr:monocarboxylate transporter 12-like isoform X2 [Actinia tenebrosa]XP_031565261.1 monocarboxylate transporter 12-like isoform X2 [Actinia tenebrosa]
MTFSPIAARLIQRFGARSVGIAGCLFAAIGLALSAFATSIYFLFGTFSLMYGLGVSCSYTACYDIVPTYFKKRLGLAIGVMSSGTGATVLIMSPINEILITNVGWRKAFYAFAGFQLLSGVCCLTFSPDVEQDEATTQEQQQSIAVVLGQTTSLRKNISFVINCVYSFCFQVGNTIPLIHLGRYALESGLSSTQTANLYVGFGVATMVGRIVSGKICESRSFHTSYICCSLAGVVAGVSNIVCPFIHGFIALTVYFCINGLADGFQVSSKSVLLMESCNARERTTAYGYLFFITSFGYLMGPPFGGLIADQVGSYIPVFYASGSIVLFSGFLILAVRCFRRKHKENLRTEVKVLLEYCVEEKVTVV